MISETFLNHLKPVELKFIQAFIYKLTHDRVTSDTSNAENIEYTVSCCPHCGSFHFVKNGFNKKNTGKSIFAEITEKSSAIRRIPFFSYKKQLPYLVHLHCL